MSQSSVFSFIQFYMCIFFCGFYYVILLLSFSLNIFILTWLIPWLMGYFLFPNICKFLLCLLLISNLIFCEISILNLQILIWWLSTWSILVTFICIWQECISKSHSCALLIISHCMFVFSVHPFLFCLCFLWVWVPLLLLSFFWDGRLVYIFSGILMFWSAFTSIKFPFPFAASTNFNMCLYNWVKIFIF